MELTKEDILKAFGIEGEVTSVDQLVQIFNSTYVPIAKASDHPEVRKATEGRIFGEQYGKLAKLSNGKFTKEQLAAKPFGEALEDFATTIYGDLETVKLKANEGKAKREAELEKEVEDYKKSLQDYERDKKTLADRLSEVETQASQKVKSYIVGMKRKEVEAKLPWKDGMTDLERAGLETFLASNYRFDADESGAIIVKDKDGHTIPSPKKAGDVISLEDVYLEVGEKNNLFKKNNTDGNRTREPQRHSEPNKSGYTPRSLPPVTVVQGRS